MSAPISDFVQLSIVAAPNPISQVGFGMALILSHSAAWAERVREYATLAGVLVDFAATTPEYKAAAKHFAQTPRPPKVLIGRAVGVPTQVVVLTPVAANLHKYSVWIDGVEATFTSDSGATVAEVCTGLKAAIDALALAITVTNSGPGNYLSCAAQVAGKWFDWSGGPSPDVSLDVICTIADTSPGIATDLAAVALERNDWYGLITLFNSAALVTAAATWAQAAGKLYNPQSIDTGIPNSTLGAGTDIAKTQKTAANDHVAVCFSPAMGDFLDAAILGKCLPLLPGSETWMFKSLSGPVVGSYTPTQRTNMRAKKCNFYEDVASRNVFLDGTVSSGSFIDAIRYFDYLMARLGERIFAALSNPAKVPYNDRGIAVVTGEILAQLEADEAREALRAGTSSVTVPTAASQTAEDRAARKLNNVTFATTFAGAIHDVVVAGTISY